MDASERPSGLHWPPSDSEPGFRVQVAVIDGRYAATELVVWPPKGRGLTRSMLHGMDIHGIVAAAVQWVEEGDQPANLHAALEPLLDGGLEGDEKLRAVANIYRQAKLLGIPLHKVAADLSVHKKTLQRWARLAEHKGFLSPEDRSWASAPAADPGYDEGVASDGND